MSEDIKISDAKRMIRKLEIELQETIKGFEDLTGLSVSNVDLVTGRKLGSNSTRVHQVAVAVELS